MSPSDSIILALPVATLLVRPEGRWPILLANDLASRLLGLPSPDDAARLQLSEVFETSAWAVLRSQLTGGDGLIVTEARLARPDGPAVLVTVRATKRPDGVFVLVLIEHNHSAAHAALIESEERYRVLVEGAGEAISVIDRDGAFRFMNTTAAQRLGGKPADYLGKTSWDVFPKEIADRHVAAIRRVIETGQELTTDSREVLQGQWYWYHTTVRPLRDATGQITMAMIIARDVTSRKEAVDALQKSENRYRTLFDSIPVAIYRSMPDGRVLDANPALYHLFGTTREAGLLPDTPKSYVNQNDRQRWREQLEAEGVVRGFEVEMQRVDGSRFWVRNTARLIRDDQGQALCFQGTLEDITDRKRAQQNLEKSEAQFRGIFEQSPVAIEVYDAEGFLTSVNSASLKLLQIESFEEIRGRNLFNNPFLTQELKESLAAGRTVRREVVLDYELIRRLGLCRTTGIGVRNVDVLIVPLTNADGTGRSGYLVHLLDVTDHKRAHEALRESEEKFRTLAENTADTLYSIDTEGRLTYLGPQARRYGIEPEKALGREFCHFVFPEDIESTLAAFQKTMTDGVSVPMEFRFVDGQGHLHWFEERSTVRRDASGTIIGIMGVLRDATFRKQAEAESLGYQQRLRSLAMELSLAEEQQRKSLAMALHDGPVQLLSVIRMRLALLDECARKAGTERSIGEIKQLVDRAMHLSRSLMLHMSHPALYEFGLVAAAEWLAEDMEELHGLKVDLSGPRESDPLDQRARVILFQCLRELLINVAKHAETDRAAVHIDWTDSSARVTVSDRGIGFDLEAARRKHDGVGFGLFSIHERIRTLGGQLEVRSSPNQGTTISITAPMDQGDSTEAERDKG